MFLDEQFEQVDSIASILSRSRKARQYQIVSSLSKSDAAYATYDILEELQKYRTFCNGIAAYFLSVIPEKTILTTTLEQKKQGL